MEELKNKPINNLEYKDIKNIKLIIFDVDGVLVPRGTMLKQIGKNTRFKIKSIGKKEINQIKILHNSGLHININSGRGLYLLEEMFREILPYVSITYENGSATWYKGKIYQHINSFTQLKKIMTKLSLVKSPNIKGFEPKEFIITIHAKKWVKKIEEIIDKEKDLFYVWNNEAYDIGIKNLQTKSNGVKKLAKLLKLKKENILVIGDNYNDQEMINEGGLKITADKSRVNGDFSIKLNNKYLPASQLMDQLIKVRK